MKMSDFVETVKNISRLKQERKAELKRKQQKNIYNEERKIKKLNKKLKIESTTKKSVDDEHKELKNEANGRNYTVSIALPGSILDNAQSPELRTYLAGQIARAAVVFQVDEIIVFDESASAASKSTDGEYQGVGKKGNPDVQLARILQYLECPQYLRKLLFPKHADLQYAGLLNPLDSPHHMKATDVVPYREGVVLDRPTKKEQGSFVDCGALKQVKINKVLQPYVRVTVKMDNECVSKKCLKGTVVSPNIPRTISGIYWGYQVRLAGSLSGIFENCPFGETYDLTIGTSERGKNVDEVSIKQFNHLLVVFGGVQGLEESLQNDDKFEDIKDPKLLFDMYLNTCPCQGSGTIRTEEAVLITMSALRPLISQK